MKMIQEVRLNAKSLRLGSFLRRRYSCLQIKMFNEQKIRRSLITVSKEYM